MKFLLHHFALDEAGGIRIGQSRVTLDSLLAAYHSGSTPEEIAVQYSVLNLEEIYESVAYYLSHRQQIDSYLEQRHRKFQQQRSEFVQQYNLANLRQRLLDRFSRFVSLGFSSMCVTIPFYHHMYCQFELEA